MNLRKRTFREWEPKNIERGCKQQTCHREESKNHDIIVLEFACQGMVQEA